MSGRQAHGTNPVLPGMKGVFCISNSKIGAIVSAILVMAWSLDAGEPVGIENQSRAVAGEQQRKSETGLASYYADKYHGRPTASGEVFDMHSLTAAHPSYRFGTRVKVTHLESNRSVIVRINDRGPFVKGRVIDLSLAAAKELRMVKAGLAQVKLEIAE